MGKEIVVVLLIVAGLATIGLCHLVWYKFEKRWLPKWRAAFERKYLPVWAYTGEVRSLGFAARGAGFSLEKPCGICATGFEGEMNWVDVRRRCPLAVVKGGALVPPCLESGEYFLQKCCCVWETVALEKEVKDGPSSLE